MQFSKSKVCPVEQSVCVFMQTGRQVSISKVNPGFVITPGQEGVALTEHVADFEIVRSVDFAITVQVEVEPEVDELIGRNTTFCSKAFTGTAVGKEPNWIGGEQDALRKITPSSTLFSIVTFNSPIEPPAISVFSHTMFKGETATICPNRRNIKKHGKNRINTPIF